MIIALTKDELIEKLKSFSGNTKITVGHQYTNEKGSHEESTGIIDVQKGNVTGFVILIENNE